MPEISIDHGDYFKGLLFGPQGSGKTFTASSIATFGKTLFLDLAGERGTRSFSGTPWEKNVDVRRPTSVTQLDDIYWFLAAGNHDYSAVVIDSLTAVQKLTMRYLLGHDETAVKEITKGAKTAEFKTWGQSLDIMTDIGVYWYGLADASESQKPMHVVMTAQAKLIETDEGEDVYVPDVQKGAMSVLLASPDYVLYTDVEDFMEGDGSVVSRHIVRFGAHSGYRTKARVPYDLRDKLPGILGRDKPLSLAALAKVMRVGGTTQAAKPAEKESKK